MLATGRLILVVVLALFWAGCLADPLKERSDPCTEPVLAGDGTWVQPDQPYWTLVTDKVPIPDGQDRVDQISRVAITHNSERVTSVTRGATVDGHTWIDRWWGCRLGQIDPLPVTEESEFLVVADPNDAVRVTLSFMFHHPEGRDIGYGPDPVWESDGPVLSERLGKINEGRHSVFAEVVDPDGSSRTQLFQVHYQETK